MWSPQFCTFQSVVFLIDFHIDRARRPNKAKIRKVGMYNRHWRPFWSSSLPLSEGLRFSRSWMAVFGITGVWGRYPSILSCYFVLEMFLKTEVACIRFTLDVMPILLMHTIV